MEANPLIQKPKKQKLNEEQSIDGNRKCFGNLPEVLLRHILSFVPIKDAVKTSVLSKRWEFLWTSNPNLDFGEHLAGKRMLLMNFVERVLYLRDSSDIKEFFLDFDVQFDASRVQSWITAAVRCNVQILSIHIRDLRGQFSLPHCVFTCETLTSLVLAMPCILKIPPIICFSNLKVLGIENVTFSDDYTTQQLFSGLPVLEVLYLMECRWGCLKVLRISAPKLHSLTIVEADMWKWNEEDCDGLSDCDDHRDFEGCRITIFGANIKCFFYTGEFFNEYWFYNSFSLERAKIDVTQSSVSYCDKRRRQVAYRMLKVLTGLANVKDLRLYQFADGVLRYAPELLPTVPIFNNLKYLELEWGDINSKALLKILQNSPYLEMLKFLEIDECFDYDKDDILLDPMPPCFLSSLEYIEVGNYDGYKTELAAVKILLKNAIALDEMVITFKEYNAGNFEMQEKLYKQLIDFPIGSQNCKIILKLAFLEHVLFRKAFDSCFFGRCKSMTR